jgi:prepilin-type N-terminal cleavage/methylation domain-containing protein
MSRGFSLIEILLTATISSLVMVASIAAYSGYESRQKIEQSARTIEADIRFAQSQALAGVKPSGCTNTLLGWYIKPDGNSYTINVRCQQQPVQVVKDVSLASDVSVTGSTIIFLPVNDGVGTINTSGEISKMTSATDLVVKKTGSDVNTNIQISPKGNIVVESNTTALSPTPVSRGKPR